MIFYYKTWMIFYLHKCKQKWIFGGPCRYKNIPIYTLFYTYINVNKSGFLGVHVGIKIYQSIHFLYLHNYRYKMEFRCVMEFGQQTLYKITQVFYDKTNSKPNL